jgi:membrane protease YdiL (CAAX protease family)
VIALAFGVMHMPSQGLYGLVVTGIVGFLMGVLFLFGKRNLLPVVLAHGLINTVSMVAASAG